MSDADQLREHADRIRASGVLGRSPLMQRLFDFLLDCTIAGKAPKEIEVAVDAFGKGAEFDVSQDAMVRVYIHKLRRKLEEFYVGAGASEPVRLSIPKGEYRFAAESVPVPVPVPPEPAPAPVVAAPSPRRKWLVGALVASLLVNAAVLLAVYLHPVAPRDEFDAVRHSPVWAPMLADDRAIFVVVGDYYIFGETDESMEVKRLVREFNINSPQDLEQQMKQHPELADRYLDLELAYLPTAAASALRDVIPVLAGANRRVRVVPMSQLNPAVIKSAHMIYVGYLSGLGLLRDLVFTGSRFSVGDSYDEIIDRSTQKRYVSQAAMPAKGDEKFHDYGYFAAFDGPSGNKIVIIAGTRDVATMQLSETVTSARTLDALVAKAGGAAEFEALYEVYGMDRMNLDGRLLLTSPLDSATIWTGPHELEKETQANRVIVETPSTP
ncbi:MAG TPA: hypothetical protein VGO53_14740 [Steroidobacteraceae bacterium]|nr:hypothetical protein [Steroidobacteraceae bacterium]